MTDSSKTALIAAAASIMGALFSGVMALWNRRKTDESNDYIESLKGGIDRDLERLRTALAHGQAVNATQWGAEFAAYQAIWKGVGEVLPFANKLVTREDDLRKIGLPNEYLSKVDRVIYRQDLTQKLAIAAKALLSAIHDNAPFYPAPIRDAADEVHRMTISLVQKNLSAITAAAQGSEFGLTPEFIEQCSAILSELTSNSETLESLIRDRLATVKIVGAIVL